MHPSGTPRRLQLQFVALRAAEPREQDRDLGLAAEPPVPSPDEGRRSRGRTLDSTHAEVFDFQIVLDAVFRALTAVPALLDPAERCNLGRDQAFIDADNAVLERFSDTPDPSYIAAVEVGRKAKLGIVREPDRLLFGLKAEYRRDRTE